MFKDVIRQFTIEELEGYKKELVERNVAYGLGGTMLILKRKSEMIQEIISLLTYKKDKEARKMFLSVYNESRSIRENRIWLLITYLSEFRKQGGLSLDTILFYARGLEPKNEYSLLLKHYPI